LVCRHTQIDDTVVEAGILLHNSKLLLILALLLSLAFSLTVLCRLILNSSGSIFDLERKNGHRSVNTPKFLDLEFDLLRC